MTIILDFDDVLFDTARFKEVLAVIFKKYKIDYKKNYNQARISKGVYSLKKRLKLAKKENKEADIKKLKKDLDKLFVNLQQFLFPDVLDFLKTFKKHNLILLSWGDKKFQKRKIYGLGQEFVSLFDKIITGPVEKAEILGKILKTYKSRPVIFIDNSPQELEKIRKRFKDVILIKINRNKDESLFRAWQESKIS